MTHSIFVFNQDDLGEIPAGEIKRDLLKVSFATLCEQYSLDDRLIAETRENLEVLTAHSAVSPFFLVKYQPSNQSPIVVFQEMLNYAEDKALLESFIFGQNRLRLAGELEQVCCIFRIDLEDRQLRDMGLLIGYEIARWLAFRGKGLVRDLQGAWYRLNVHQAFIPIPGK